MSFYPLLAHGALGNWDEIIFIGVAVLFFVFMGISWLRSSSEPVDDSDLFAQNPPQQDDDSERFRLD